MCENYNPVFTCFRRSTSCVQESLKINNKDSTSGNKGLDSPFVVLIFIGPSMESASSSTKDGNNPFTRFQNNPSKEKSPFINIKHDSKRHLAE